MSKLALGCALLLILAAPAAAQVKSGADPARFDVADANKDGQVDRAEYGNFVEEWVLLNDADRDGKLSRDEVKSAPDPSKFDTIDGNRDGFLVIEELNAYSDSDFAAMDANSDGKIDKAESAQRK